MESIAEFHEASGVAQSFFLDPRPINDIRDPKCGSEIGLDPPVHSGFVEVCKNVLAHTKFRRRKKE